MMQNQKILGANISILFKSGGGKFCCFWSKFCNLGVAFLPMRHLT